MKDEHSKLPWHLDGSGVFNLWIRDPNDVLIARMKQPVDPSQVIANGEFLVRAVNSHHALLSIAYRQLAIEKEPEVKETIRKTIERAEAK